VRISRISSDKWISCVFKVKSRGVQCCFGKKLAFLHDYLGKSVFFLVLYDGWLLKPASCNGPGGGWFTTFYNLLQLFTSCYKFGYVDKL
jgi:hypothetical protein